MRTPTKQNTLLNLRDLTEPQIKEVLTLLRGVKTSKDLQWKLDNEEMYLERLRSFLQHNNVYILLCSNGRPQYSTETIIPNPDYHILVDLALFKKLHFSESE